MTRTVLTGTALALALSLSLGGCKDNEQSFYIEHMKVLPDPPECKVSTGDAVLPEIIVDLALAGYGDFFAWFQVTNGMMAREDYDNLKAESNGIFVDGAESALSIGDSPAGGEETDVNMYIEPESSSILPGILLTAQGFADLAAANGCLPVSEQGTAVRADLADGNLDNPPTSEILGTGYGRVRFVGHTQGGIDVETNPFTFAVSLCCNCYVNWSEVADPCSGFCQEVSEYTTCAWGVNSGNNLFPAHNVTLSPGAEWDTGDGGVEDCSSCS